MKMMPMKMMISRIYSWLTACFGHNDDHEMWSRQIPNDVMGLVLQRLPRPDYIQCRDVCPTWRDIIDSSSAAPHHLLPWLLLDSKHLFFIKDGCLVSDHRKISTLVKPRCVGSIEGWLIMHEYVKKSRYFLNPITGARVILPSSKCIEKEKVVASSVPTRREHCYVVSLNLLSGRLAFCRPTDQSWTPIEAFEPETENALDFRDVEIVAGKLYAATSSALEFLMVFDINLNGGVPSYTAERVVMHYPSDGGIKLDYKMYFRTWYLVKDFESHELFLILRHTALAQVTEGFQVLKLEHCDSSGGARWVEIVDLGSRILFVSMLNNKCISSERGLSGSNDKTLERNCIYFAFDWHSTETSPIVDFGVFSLTKRSVKPLSCPINHLSRELNQIVWFTPDPW
ncbi:hypothetical protein ABKV19_012501 [Rosa sericea]